MAAHPLAGNGTPLLWLLFALPVLALLGLDFGLFLRSPRPPTLKESLAWTLVWATLAGLFGIGLTAALGPAAGLSFFTAYVVEQALSVDNLFVFLVVFNELAVPEAGRKRALAWGILGALVLRVAMLAAGGAFLERFHMLAWALGGLLVVMGVRAGWRLWRPADGGAEAPAHGAAVRILERWLPIHDAFDGDRFSTEVGGRFRATPLLVAVVTILFADVVFAFDSIPAVLGVTTSRIVVVTSNVFAVLGLRAMFFLLQGLLSRLRYLPHGLAAVLVVVGAKMLLGSVLSIPTWLSLALVLSVLGAAVLASLHASPSSDDPEHERWLHMLNDREYTLILDKSGSMATKDQPGGRSRWAAARESALALAAKCEELDHDGLTLYVFGSRFRRYDNVTAERVGQVFSENEPAGGTDLAAVLEDAFAHYFARRSKDKSAARPETILVVTDGEPDDGRAVVKSILGASRRIDRDEELAVSFVQVGKDPNARRFLKLLDDELVGAGAPFDICDTVTLDEAEEMGLTEVLMSAIHD